MSTAFWKMYHTRGAKVFLEDGSVIDLFDDHKAEHIDRMVDSLANVIRTYGITRLIVDDPMMADETVENVINQILIENYGYAEHVKLEVKE